MPSRSSSTLTQPRKALPFAVLTRGSPVKALKLPVKGGKIIAKDATVSISGAVNAAGVEVLGMHLNEDLHLHAAPRGRDSHRVGAVAAPLLLGVGGVTHDALGVEVDEEDL